MHVEGGSCDPAAVEGLEERLVVDQLPARRIRDAYTRLDLGEGRTPEQRSASCGG
jgi:hypothetical protein